MFIISILGDFVAFLILAIVLKFGFSLIIPISMELSVIIIVLLYCIISFYRNSWDKLIRRTHAQLSTGTHVANFEEAENLYMTVETDEERETALFHMIKCLHGEVLRLEASTDTNRIDELLDQLAKISQNESCSANCQFAQQKHN